MAKIRDIYFFFKIWWGGNSLNKYDVVCMYLNFVLNKIYNRFLNPKNWYIMINVQCNKTMKWSEIDWIYKIHLIFVAVIDTAIVIDTATGIMISFHTSIAKGMTDIISDVNITSSLLAVNVNFDIDQRILFNDY